MKKMIVFAIAAAVALTPTTAYANKKDDRIAELEARVAELEAELAKYKGGESKEEYQIGDTWTVPGQWSFTITGVTETDERNEYDDRTPEAVYIVDYTYENLGYETDMEDGLYMEPFTGIVDSQGTTGYGYPASIVYYPTTTPVGATCNAQIPIGVEHAGNFKINFSQYDSNATNQKAVFSVEVE